MLSTSNNMAALFAMSRLSINKRSQIGSLIAAGLSDQAIAQQVPCHRKTVAAWRQRGVGPDSKDEELRDKPHLGGKRKLSARDEANVETQATKRHKSTREIAQAMREKGASAWSQSTIVRTLHRRGLKSHRRPRRQELSDAHIAARLQFCKDNRNTDWSKVVFSDETPFNSQKGFNPKNECVWTHSSDRVQAVKVRKRGFSYPCWAAISVRGKTPLVHIKGALDKEKYIGILQRTLLPCARRWFRREQWTFQQDGAGFHTAGVVQRWLAGNVPKFIRAEEWPACSPDLNPIENLWGTVLSRARKSQCTTKRGWQLALAHQWALISVEDLQRLIGSMDRRIRACIRACGGTFDKRQRQNA
jgi:transposase